MRIAPGIINLDKPPSRAVLADEFKQRGNTPASEDDTASVLVEWPSSYHKARNEDATHIPQMTVNGVRKRRWLAASDTGIAGTSF